jgi:DNA uptake protein ComE-like DNA-binding protein
MNLKRCVPAQAFLAILAIFLACPIGAAFGTGTKTTAAKTTTKSRKLVDVNRATLEELAALPGIQDAYAAKIVKHRPYANKSQLSSEGVIPAATYRKIRALIIAKQ